MKLKKYNYTVDKMKLKVCAIRFNDKISFIYQNILRVWVMFQAKYEMQHDK